MKKMTGVPNIVTRVLTWAPQLETGIGIGPYDGWHTNTIVSLIGANWGSLQKIL